MLDPTRVRGGREDRGDDGPGGVPGGSPSFDRNPSRCPTNPPCANTVSTEIYGRDDGRVDAANASSTRGSPGVAHLGLAGPASAPSSSPRAFLLCPLHGVQARVGVTGRRAGGDLAKTARRRPRLDIAAAAWRRCAQSCFSASSAARSTRTRAEAFPAGSRGTTLSSSVPRMPGDGAAAPATASSAIRGSRPCTTIRGS